MRLSFGADRDIARARNAEYEIETGNRRGNSSVPDERARC